jgi:small-conductance mechanosensitive channel
MTELPECGPNPMQAALRDWDKLQQNLMVATDQVQQMTDMNSKLLAENDMLRDTLETTRRQKDYLQAYATTLTTRLKVVVEIVAEATSEAAKFAVESLQPKQDTAQLDRASEEGLAALNLSTAPPQNQL